jgi:signal peptidase I
MIEIRPMIANAHDGPGRGSDCRQPAEGRKVRRWLIGRHPRRTLMRALLLALVLYGLFGRVFRLVWVDGSSMEPTIKSGTLHLINQWSYRRESPRRGDIVAIRLSGTRVMYLKRIRFDHGRFWVDGAPLDEPYVRIGGAWSTAEYCLEEGEYYVAGDNRSGPYRAHATGIANREDIVGRLQF